MDPYKPPEAQVADSGGAEIDPAQAAAIKARLKQLNLKSFGLALPGLMLQFTANIIADALGLPFLASVLSLTGIVLFTVGLCYYAVMRGRHLAWGLLGLLSCVGLLILYFLPKNCLHCESKANYRLRQCETCGGPLGA